MKRLRIYYAHPMSWYNTTDEAADIRELEKYGEVINPNSLTFHKAVEVAQQRNYPAMEIFANYIRDHADVVAFRAFKDLKLGAGVAREIFEAIIWEKKLMQIFGKPDRLFVNTALDFEPGVYPADITFGDILSVEDTKARVARGEL